MNPRERLAGKVGIYEKSLPAVVGTEWGPHFDLAARSGYDFVEMSIDESADRLGRLDWRQAMRAAVRASASDAGVAIGTICLSAQRTFPMGSADARRRVESVALATKAVQLAADLDAPLVQLAGYFTFYEDPWPDARKYFLEGLAAVADIARTHGIRLAIENVDGRDVTTVAEALALIRESATGDAVGLYVDVGNNIGNGHDPVRELEEAWPAVDAIQFKDAKPGVFRRVPFGEGDVPWTRLFRFLKDRGYRGPVSVEMWNDDGEPDLAGNALRWLTKQGLAHVRAS